ncbi:MAG: hypothetical protein H7296_09810 [Bacteroidia bacterium]|nr:hypothetical protein [Bacteroidia bacterium]
MKKTEKKTLKKNLFTAIKKVLSSNKAELTEKTEKAVKKSIKKIVKKTNIIDNNDAVKDKKVSASNSSKNKSTAVSAPIIDKKKKGK